MLIDKVSKLFNRRNNSTTEQNAKRSRFSLLRTRILVAAVLLSLASAAYLGRPALAENSLSATASVWSLADYVLTFFGKDTPQRRRSRPADPGSKRKGNIDTASMPAPVESAAPCSFGATTRDVPGTYATIQAAVNAANSGDKIVIAAGSYVGQFVVSGKCLKITGAGSDPMTGTRIVSPAGSLAISTTSGVANTAAIVELRGTSYVDMSGVLITGPVPFTTAVAGVMVNESSTLKMADSRVTAIRPATGLTGDQNGWGVLVGSDDFNQVGSIDFNNVTVDDYNKNGIMVGRDLSNATITGSTILGSGSPAPLAQNGIVIRDDATATITGNQISGNLCGSVNCGFTQQFGFGVLLNSAKTSTVSQNQFSNNDGGIYAWTPGASSTLDLNTFTQTKYAAIDIDEGTATVTRNLITGSAFGPVTGLAATAWNGNTQNSTATFYSNVVTGASQSGIEIFDENDSDGVIASADATFNVLISNAVGINKLATSGVITQSNNFWGCNTGPNTVGCDASFGLTGSDPYLKLTGISATPPTVEYNGASTISGVSLRKNSAGADTYSLPGNPHVLDGLFTVFSTSPGTAGTITGPTSANFTNGVTTGTTFTAGPGPYVGNQIENVAAAFGNASITTPVTVHDSTAPTILSFSADSGSPQNSTSNTFTATFSEPVINFTTSDVTLTGTAPGASVTGVTQITPTTWQVAVSVTAGTGSYTVTIPVGSVDDTATPPNQNSNTKNATVTYGGGTSFVVDDLGVNCLANGQPLFTNIPSAVAAATTGTTIRVCPGTYPQGTGQASLTSGKSNVTIIKAQATKPIIQVQGTGYNFLVTADHVTIEGLEIHKTDNAVNTNHNIVGVQGTNFTAQNLDFISDIPWYVSVNNPDAVPVSRAFEVSSTSALGVNLNHNTITNFRQPGYINGDGSTNLGTISNNVSSGTKGWVFDNAIVTMSANTFPASYPGAPTTLSDIAVFPSASSTVQAFWSGANALAISAANDNAYIDLQWTVAGDDGRAISYVDDVPTAGNGRTVATAHNSIQTAIDNTLIGGTVHIQPGTFVQEANVNRTVKVEGSGPEGANQTTVSGPAGGNTATLKISANDVSVSGLKITREGNNPTHWNDGNLKISGISIQGLTVTGALIHDNYFYGNRTGIDINNSGGHTIRNNKIDLNRTGLIFRNQTDNIAILENDITNNYTVGIVFLDASGGSNIPVQTFTNSAVTNNNISGNWYGQIVDRQTDGGLPLPGANPKNFQGNWYGVATPLVVTANSAEPGGNSPFPSDFGGSDTPPGGQPDIAGPASANFRYDHPLTEGTDTNVETTPGRGTYGFQGAPIDVAQAGQSPSPTGWFFFNEGANGNGGLENGPGGVRPGSVLCPGSPTCIDTGSARLSVDANGREDIATAAYAGVRFDQMTALSYSSYQLSGNALATPSFQFDVDLDLTDANESYQGRLVYEPYLDPANTIQQGQWQTWNVLSPTAKYWISSLPSGPCSQSSPCDRSTLLGTYQNIGVHHLDIVNGFGGLLFRMGGPVGSDTSSYVDNFTIDIATGHSVFDFQSDNNDAPTITSITRGGTNPTNANSVAFNVTFSEFVNGVDAGDFELSTTGVSSPIITGVTGSGSNYVVSVSTGSGDGTIRLDAKSTAIITDIAGNPFVGPYTGGETYDVDRTAPTGTLVQASGQPDPTSGMSVDFTVQFGEPVTGFDASDVSVATGPGTAFSSPSSPVVNVAQSVLPMASATYTVTVTGMNQPGQVTASVGAGAAQDAAGNQSVDVVEGDNTVYYTVGASTLVVDTDGMASDANFPASCGDATPTAYTTIQAAINAASPGNTIKVCPGVYEELVDVNKAVTLEGPNAGINPNTTAPSDATSAIIRIPDTTLPDATWNTGNILVNISSKDVTINGFTIDGDNPDVTGGVDLNGANVDAGWGILEYGLQDPHVSISNSYIRNLGEMGTYVSGGGGSNRTGSIINNKYENIPGVGTYGGGIHVRDNAWTNITGNTLTKVNIGISLENMSANAADPSINISNNTVSARALGIRTNLAYSFTGTTLTVSDNNISSFVDTSSGAMPNTKWRGIRIESWNTGVPLTVSGNTITPDRGALLTAGYTRIDGIWLTNTYSTSNAITINGNKISNTLRGISDTIPGTPTITCNTIYNNEVGIYVGRDVQYGGSSESYATGGVNASQNNLVGNTLFGIQKDTSAGLPPDTGGTTIGTVNADANYWGSTDGPGPVGTGLGDKVSSNVDFSSPETAPSCGPVVNYVTTSVAPASGQSSPTNLSPVHFTVTFSDAVTGFDTGDLRLSGTAGATTAVITGSGSSYDVAVSAMASSGTIVLEVYSGAGVNISGIPSTATSTPATINWDVTGPTPTVTPVADPDTTSPVDFTVDFGESVSGSFDTSDLSISGGAGANSATITDNGGGSYTVHVTGMNASGSVVLEVHAGAVTDALGNPSTGPVSASAQFNQSTGTTVITPASSSWFFWDDTTDKTCDPDYAFGPAGGPLPVGSARLLSSTCSAMVPTSDRKALFTKAFQGTRLDAITTLSYSTYVPTAAGTNVPTLQIGVDFTGAANPAYQGRLVYVPTGVVNDTWQTWNLDLSTAKFYYSSPTSSPNADGCLMSQGTGCTLAMILAAHPNARIMPNNGPNPPDTWGVVGFRTEAGSNANVDNFTIGINSANTVVNFEPAGTTVVSSAQMNGWLTASTAPAAITSFRTGPATPPLGTGSAHFTVGADGDQSSRLYTEGFSGVKLSSLTSLSYSTYVEHQGSGGQATYMVLRIDKDGDGIPDDRLFFEPVYQSPSYGMVSGNGPIPDQCGGHPNCVDDSGSWQTWNALAGGWWLDSDATYGPPLRTIAGMIAAYPNAQILNDPSQAQQYGPGGIYFASGTGAGAWDNFVGDIDDVSIGVNGAVNTYNFEAAPPTVSISGGNATEGGNITFTVSLTGDSPSRTLPVTVHVATSDGSATAPADYTSYNQDVTISGGSSSTTFTVATATDNVAEGDETFTATLTNAANAGIGTAAATGTINDGAGYVAIGGQIKAYAGGVGIDGVTVTLSGTSNSTPINLVTTTSGGGFYNFDTGVATIGEYTVTPSCPSGPCSAFVFDPSAREYRGTNAIPLATVTTADFLGYNGDNPRDVIISDTFQTPVLPGQPTGVGADITVPIKIRSQGTENAVSFSLVYDSSKIQFKSAVCDPSLAAQDCVVTQPGPGGSPTTLVMNLNFGEALPATATPQTVLLVTFTATPGTSTSTSLAFSTTAPKTVANTDGIDVPADWINGTITFATGFEADVAGGSPASSGIPNGTITSGDVTRIQNLVAHNVTPNPNVNEYQRADCAPYGTRGNGVLSSGDVTVAQRYASGDLIGVHIPAAGPTFGSRPAPDKERRSVVRPLEGLVAAPGDVSVVGARATPGGTADVDIELIGRGNEAGFSFTIEFDPSVLSSPVVTVGSGAAPYPHFFTANTSQAANGQIGILYNTNPVVPMLPPGAKNIVHVTFMVSAGATVGSTTPIRLTSSFIPQDVSDVNGDPTDPNWIDGGVEIALAPTAANATIAGQVKSLDGRAIGGATVTLRAAAGGVRTAVTSPMGYYRFEDVPVGETYVLGASAKRYRFDTRTITVGDDATNIDLIARE